MNQKLTNIVADLPEKIRQSIESGGPVPLAYLDKARAYWEEAKAQGVRPPEMTENDWWGDFLRDKYLPVARLAKIPPRIFSRSLRSWIVTLITSRTGRLQTTIAPSSTCR